MIHGSNFQITTAWSSSGNSNKLIPGVTTTTVVNEALKDYNGRKNNTSIIAIETYQDTAAMLCASNVFPSTSTVGYLGSVGEWEEVKNNLKEINELLLLSNKLAIDETVFWTSTQQSSIGTWVYNMYTKGCASQNKLDKFNVRQFCEIPKEAIFA